MELSQLSTIRNPLPATFTFQNPFTNENTDIKITMYSENSREGKSARHEMTMKIIELQKDGKEATEEIMQPITIEWIANLTNNIDGLTIGKKKLAQTKEEFIRIYTDSIELMNGTYLIDACYNFAKNSGNFSAAQLPTI